MSLHLYSPKEKAITLVSFRNSENILVFPSQNTRFPGLHFDVRPLVPINEQIIVNIERYCGLANLGPCLEIDQAFAELVNMGDEDATLYLASMKRWEGDLPRYLQTLPILIRGLPRERARLSYLKAFQVLSGAREQDIRILET